MSHPLLEGRLLVLAELAFSMFVLLGTLEAAARWVTPQPVEEMRDAYLARMHRLDDPCPALSTLGPRVPGKRRVAVVGESNGVYLAMGMERIATSCPALGWEVVTCAEAAVGPIDAGRQLDQLAGADVDEVVVVIGNNPMAFYPTPSMARDVYEALVHSRVLARFLMPTALVSAPPMAFYEERWERVFASIDVMRRRVPVKVVEPHVQPWVFRGPSSPQSERAAWWLLGGERARAREALRTLGDDASPGVRWRPTAGTRPGGCTRAIRRLGARSGMTFWFRTGRFLRLGASSRFASTGGRMPTRPSSLLAGTCSSMEVISGIPATRRSPATSGRKRRDVR